jgi:transcriptional antiterminator RfaH
VPYWACAQTEPRREAAAQHFLQLAGYRVYLPRLRLVRSSRGHKIETRPPLFPAYLFVWISEGWWQARWCPHVIRLLAAGRDGPMHVSDAIVDAIKSREISGLVELPKREGFKPGDSVRILQGPLQGLCGLYAGMRPHERVLVLLALLGGQQRVELARDAVEVVR